MVEVSSYARVRNEHTTGYAGVELLRHGKGVEREFVRVWQLAAIRFPDVEFKLKIARMYTQKIENTFIILLRSLVHSVCKKLKKSNKIKKQMTVQVPKFW